MFVCCVEGCGHALCAVENGADASEAEGAGLGRQEEWSGS
jgi:hypothetical protein